jgi:hypothetical protein
MTTDQPTADAQPPLPAADARSRPLPSNALATFKAPPRAIKEHTFSVRHTSCLSGVVCMRLRMREPSSDAYRNTGCAGLPPQTSVCAARSGGAENDRRGRFRGIRGRASRNPELGTLDGIEGRRSGSSVASPSLAADRSEFRDRPCPHEQAQPREPSTAWILPTRNAPTAKAAARTFEYLDQRSWVQSHFQLNAR